MSADSKTAQPGLKRVLGLRELVLYGIIIIQPTAALPLYGEVSAKAHGHVVTTILIAMVAMLFTAISYGRMANAYPRAGSAYTYVGQELHPALGYLTGWAMVFDYVMNPIISVIFCSETAMTFLPEVPFKLWAVFFAVLFTILNLRGIKASAGLTSGSLWGWASWWFCFSWLRSATFGPVVRQSQSSSCGRFMTRRRSLSRLSPVGQRWP